MSFHVSLLRYSHLFFLLFFFNFHHVCVIATTDEFDLRGPFVRRYGVTNCPDNIYIDSDTFNFSISSLFVNQLACTSGNFTVVPSPRRAPSGGDLAPYLLSTRGVGQVVGIDFTKDVICTNTTFDERVYFTLFRPQTNVTINWSTIFRRNDTILHTATASSTFTFMVNVSYLVVNSICLYTSLTKDEFDQQRPEACFPRSAKVYLPNQTYTHINALQLGQSISIPSIYHNNLSTTVFAWTHKDFHRIAPFLRIVIQSGHELVVSHGHYIYANNKLLPARNVEIGMRLHTTLSNYDPIVRSVDTVWRIGLFNPQTIQGDIIVNGFVCSTYTEAVPPMIAHALLTPLRFVFSNFHLVFTSFDS